jgi:hypothetical protein
MSAQKSPKTKVAIRLRGKSYERFHSVSGEIGAKVV